MTDDTSKSATFTYEMLLDLYHKIADQPQPPPRLLGVYYHAPGEPSEKWMFCPNPCSPAAHARYKAAVVGGAVEEPWYG